MDSDSTNRNTNIFALQTIHIPIIIMLRSNFALLHSISMQNLRNKQLPLRHQIPHIDKPQHASHGNNHQPQTQRGLPSTSIIRGLAGRPDQYPRPCGNGIIARYTGSNDQRSGFRVLRDQFRQPGEDQGCGAQGEVGDEVCSVGGGDGNAGGVGSPEGHCYGWDEADERLSDD